MPGLPSDLFLSHFPTKILYTSLSFPDALHVPPISLFSILSPEHYVIVNDKRKLKMYLSVRNGFVSDNNEHRQCAVFCEEGTITVPWKQRYVTCGPIGKCYAYISFIQVQLDVNYILYFFLDNSALHVSGAICTHHQEHNCSVQL
jgi:hypothetical protein